MTEIADFDFKNTLLDTFIEVCNFENNKLPYHINILDIMRANENANSRILMELLKHKEDDYYDLLDIFFKNILKTDMNFNISKPIITAEKDRIDLLILDKDYAVIIENKIHNAKDQENQIARYIDKVLKKKYPENNIYVIYLTREGIKKPNEQSWIYEGQNYKERFAKRYFSLSYKYDILSWLKDYVLPNCRVKDVYLKSTIEQYIDYLEGMFNKRKIHKNMNNELHNHIRVKLKLNSSPTENIKILEQKQAGIIKLETQFNNLMYELKTECLIDWYKNLESKNDYEKFKNDDVDCCRNIGVIMQYKGERFSVLIEIDNNDIYYGIGRHNASEELIEILEEFTKQFIDGFEKNNWWYGFKYTTIEEGYNDVCSLIKRVVETIKNKA